MTVTVCSFAQLPEWVNPLDLSNNGCGVEYASYLIIEIGEHRACYSDAMEPEDVSFRRDLSWIKDELLRAYARK